MSIAKIETASGVTLLLNGKTVFASDDTSYWMQGSKIIDENGWICGNAETIRDALCIVLAKYGGLKGNSAKQTKPVKAVRAWVLAAVCIAGHEIARENLYLGER